jgi:hypothetical protein
MNVDERKSAKWFSFWRHDFLMNTFYLLRVSAVKNAVCTFVYYMIIARDARARKRIFGPAKVRNHQGDRNRCCLTS